ncbi:MULTISPECIES: IclR family transcriptional regulator [unclassified Variovorax]|uniref:IclR family transcriptional regulator n=1 Tax=unclassified Variovorax TaxID=663243 RepID=UPI001BD35B92|nr:MULTISPECIES: IclR family transcriptional regulator [unclassified Variovorax]
MNNTLVKGLGLLETLTRSGKPMGVSQLALATGLPKSGAHRLLQALVDAQYVQRFGSGTYGATIKLWGLGSAALSGFDLRRHADKFMDELTARTGETVHLSVLDHREVVYVHKVTGPDPVPAHKQIGGRAPAHCVATGKAMMAFKGAHWLADAVMHLDAATPMTLTVPDVFMAQMQRIRRDGFAVNHGEWRLDLHGLAAPIFDAAGTVVAAVGVSGFAHRLPLHRLHELADDVMQVARAMSPGLECSTPHAALLGVTSHWRTADVGGAEASPLP